MINSNFYGKDCPEIINKDSNGVVIKPGSRIAYNRSGSVILGEIVSLDRSEWKVDKYYERSWYLMFSLKVKDLDGTVSTIKNPNSFVIIEL